MDTHRRALNRTVQGFHTLEVVLYRVATHWESHCTGWPHIGSCAAQGSRTLGVALYSMAAHMELYCTVADEPSRGPVDEVQA